MKKVFAFLLLGCALNAAPTAAHAKDLPPGERAALLDTARPAAAKLAGQAVRIKVDKLNVDGGWAVLVGSLVSADGKGMDWNRAKGCQPDLDRMLWVVMKKTGADWRVQEIDICAAEPPYWELASQQQYKWPCGVYANLFFDGEESLEARCRKRNR